MWTPELCIALICSFILAGTVKGVIGLGFPTIILALLSIMLGVREAMALMLLPCLLTNVWQALSGGNFRYIFKKIWPLLAMVCLATYVTTSVVGNIDTVFLSCFLGIILLLYGSIGLTGYGLVTPKRYEKFLTPVIGVVNGTITGFTGTFVVPGVLYLQSLQIKRDQLIQAMGILFVTSTAALGTGLFSHKLLDNQLLFFSGLSLIPSFIGMFLGQKIRILLPEKGFQKIFYSSLLILGSYIILRSLTQIFPMP